MPTRKATKRNPRRRARQDSPKIRAVYTPFSKVRRPLRSLTRLPVAPELHNPHIAVLPYLRDEAARTIQQAWRDREQRLHAAAWLAAQQPQRSSSNGSLSPTSQWIADANAYQRKARRKKTCMHKRR